MANFRPLYDRVLVKRIESEQKSAGGLFIPETAKEKPQQAEVDRRRHGPAHRQERDRGPDREGR